MFYAALIDSGAVQQWMVPDSMTSHVHSFEAREGGTFRVSLTYDAPAGTGKTSARTDTYHGRFVRLVPGEEVVQVMEFETADPALRGEMTITFTLADAAAGDGTDLTGVHAEPPFRCAAGRQRTRLARVSRQAGTPRRVRLSHRLISAVTTVTPLRRVGRVGEPTFHRRMSFHSW